MRGSIFGAVVAATFMTTAVAHGAGKVVIGTGGETGVYYATGQALCAVLTAMGEDCEAPPSGGSVANLKALQAGAIGFAMVQSDWQFHAYQGSKQWDGAAMGVLRAVFSVYAEPIQVVVNRDAGIKNWYALKGKRINIGNVGSGHRQTLDLMLDAQHWKLDAFGTVSELPSSEQVDAFCAGKFDAFVYAVGVPNDAMRHAVAGCNGMLIEPHNTIVRKLATAARPYYAKVAIPAGTYWDGQKKVDTFGVMATLVTTAKTDAVAVGKLVKAVFDNLDAFKSKHPAFAAATPETMVAEGLSAPLHDAAKAYYASKGWVK